MEDNGGSIKVENNVAGGGVTFTITLPVKAAVRGVIDVKILGRIYLVDDDELILDMLSRALSREGYETRTATQRR